MNDCTHKMIQNTIFNCCHNLLIVFWCVLCYCLLDYMWFTPLMVLFILSISLVQQLWSPVLHITNTLFGIGVLVVLSPSQKVLGTPSKTSGTLSLKIFGAPPSEVMPHLIYSSLWNCWISMIATPCLSIVTYLSVFCLCL